MRQDAIIVGDLYVTRIGRERALVVVTRIVDTSRGKRFAVRRLTEKNELPKLRHARALHPERKSPSEALYDATRRPAIPDMSEDDQ